MFSNLKTSTKISIKFTIFTLFIVVFFGIIINILFFQNWYNNTNKQLLHRQTMSVHMRKILGKNRFGIIEKFPLISQEAKKLLANKIFNNISKIDDQYFIFKIINKNIIFVQVTKQVEMQILLLRISFLLMFFFSIFSYFISLFFVKTSLRSLKELVKYAKNIKFDNLNKKFNIKGPKQDEIKILSEVLFESLQKIHKLHYL